MLREPGTSGPRVSWPLWAEARTTSLWSLLLQAPPGAAHRGPRPSDESATKLEIAGADRRIISSYAVGGRRLSSLATQPLVVNLLEVMPRGKEGLEFRLEELVMPKTSASRGGL